MTSRCDDRIRRLVATIEQAREMARAAGEEVAETLLEATLEAILIGPAEPQSADLMWAVRHEARHNIG